MYIVVVTLFPELIRELGRYGVVGRALSAGGPVAGDRVRLDTVNPRDFTRDRHNKVDAKPYGGGPGMLMKTGPLLSSIDEARRRVEAEMAVAAQVVHMSPQGRLLRQRDLEQLAAGQGLVVIAGRYEGVDERVIESRVDAEFSVGDFVVSGGELPAMMLIDGLLRLRPGTLGCSESARYDSFGDGLLKGPQYTRPEVVNAGKVPEVLLSGDHVAIARWKRRQSLGRTWLRRPDLLRGRTLNQDDLGLLADFVAERTLHNKEADREQEEAGS